MPTAIVFDVDGTLLDSVDLHARAWQDAFRAFGRTLAFDAIRSQIGKGGDQLLPVFLDPAECEAIGPKIEAERSAVFKRDYMAEVRPFGSVRALFERVRAAGLRIALASSSKGEELEVYAKLARIDDLIDEATTSDDAARSKPHPDIFGAALSRLGDPDAADVIVVGDSPYDAEAASKAGLRTVGVLCGGFAAADLTGAGCVALFDDPADLLRRFDRSPLSP